MRYHQIWSEELIVEKKVLPGFLPSHERDDIVITMRPYFYVYLWLFMFTFSLFFMTIWPEYIAPLYNKYTPIEEGPVYDAIKKLADSVEFPLTELFVVDGSQHSAYSNAYFYV